MILKCTQTLISAASILSLLYSECGWAVHDDPVPQRKVVSKKRGYSKDNPENKRNRPQDSENKQPFPAATINKGLHDENKNRDSETDLAQAYLDPEQMQDANEIIASPANALPVQDERIVNNAYPPAPAQGIEDENAEREMNFARSILSQLGLDVPQDITVEGIKRYLSLFSKMASIQFADAKLNKEYQDVQNLRHNDNNGKADPVLGLNKPQQSKADDPFQLRNVKYFLTECRNKILESDAYKRIKDSVVINESLVNFRNIFNAYEGIRPHYTSIMDQANAFMKALIQTCEEDYGNVNTKLMVLKNNLDFNKFPSLLQPFNLKGKQWQGEFGKFCEAALRHWRVLDKMGLAPQLAADLNKPQPMPAPAQMIPLPQQLVVKPAHPAPAPRPQARLMATWSGYKAQILQYLDKKFPGPLARPLEGVLIEKPSRPSKFVDANFDQNNPAQFEKEVAIYAKMLEDIESFKSNMHIDAYRLAKQQIEDFRDVRVFRAQIFEDTNLMISGDCFFTYWLRPQDDTKGDSGLAIHIENGYLSSDGRYFGAITNGKPDYDGAPIDERVAHYHSILSEAFELATELDKRLEFFLAFSPAACLEGKIWYIERFLEDVKKFKKTMQIQDDGNLDMDKKEILNSQFLEIFGKNPEASPGDLIQKLKTQLHGKKAKGQPFTDKEIEDFVNEQWGLIMGA